MSLSTKDSLWTLKVTCLEYNLVVALCFAKYTEMGIWITKDSSFNYYNTRIRVKLHLIKSEWLIFLLIQYCLDFSIFTKLDSEFHFSSTLTTNFFFWTRNKNDECLRYITSSTLVKCNSMIISFVMPSYPNVTLFL